MNTFSGFCIAACIFLIFIGMGTGVVSTLDQGSFHVFSASPDINTSEAQKPTQTNYFDLYNVLIAYGAAIAITSILSYLTGTSNLIVVWIFGGVFWASWGSLLPVFYTGGFMNTSTGLAIVGMLTFGMTVMFIGAIIGLLSPGGTSMR
jgi:hypothetical protein